MCISKNMQTHILAGNYLKRYEAFSNSKHIKVSLIRLNLLACQKENISDIVCLPEKPF